MVKSCKKPCEGNTTHRKECNRISAARSRERKAEYMNQLEAKVKELEQELIKVKSDNKKLQICLRTFDERKKIVEIIRTIKEDIDRKFDETATVIGNTERVFPVSEPHWVDDSDTYPPFIFRR